MTGVNPYPVDTYEHRLWEDWNREFFRQPVHAQLLDIEQEMRAHIHTMAELMQRLDDGEVKRALIQRMLAAELTLERVSDMAEHQYLTLVSRPAQPAGDGS